MQTNTEIVTASTTPAASAAVESFFRRRRLFLWTVLAIFVVTLGVTFLTRKQYSSDMKFLVQNTRENVLLTPERTAPSNLMTDVTETQVNSELEILHSRDVLDPVADPTWEQTPEADRSPQRIRQHELQLLAFEKRLNAEPVRRTNILRVSVLADSPEAAQQDLERLSAAYLAKHRRLQRPEGTSSFFTAEAERSRKAWDDAAQKLVDFQRENQLLSLPGRSSTLNEQITKNEADILKLDAILHEMDGQLAEGTKQLAGVPMRQTTQEKAMPNQESIQQMNKLLVDLQNKRTGLLTNYKANDRFVTELDEQIATTKAALQDATSSTSHERTTDVDPAWQQVHTNYVQTKIARHATELHRASLVSQVNTLKQQLTGSESKTVEYNNLESRANELKANYELYAQKRDQAQMEDAMDEHKLLNIAVAQQATISYAPVKPKRLLTLALGSLTALFAGFCLVYFAEAGRSTVATPRELDSLSRYPVLATVPYLPFLEAASTEAIRAVDRSLAEESTTTQRSSGTLGQPTLGYRKI